MRKTKVRYDRIVILVIVLVLIIGGIFLFNRINKDKDPINNGSKEMMINLVNKDLSTANFFANQYNITFNVTYKYDDNIPKDNIISQDVKVGTDVKEIKEINIIVSKGKVSKEDLKNDGINEIGSVPIMMYHNIKHMNNSDTKYTNGNKSVAISIKDTDGIAGYIISITIMIIGTNVSIIFSLPFFSIFLYNIFYYNRNKS